MSWRPAALLALAACAHAPASPGDVTPAMLRRVKADGPNASHMRRLAALAPRLAHAEGAEPRLVVAAALLHDATKEDGEGTPFERFCTHGQQGAAHARAVLPGLGYDARETEVVALAIEQHMGPCGVSASRGTTRFMTGFCQRDFPAPASAEAKVLFDLDMLDLMTVNGVAKVVALRQRGAEFQVRAGSTAQPAAAPRDSPAAFPASRVLLPGEHSQESVRASAETGPDPAWKSVLDAGETLLTPSGRACGAALTAHTRAFLDQVDYGRVATAEAFQAAVTAWLARTPLPACFTP